MWCATRPRWLPPGILEPAAMLFHCSPVHVVGLGLLVLFAPPAAYFSVASLFAAFSPIMVTKMVLVEYVFSIPGLFRDMRRAIGQSPGFEGVPDVPMLQAIALWAAVLIVALDLLADLAVMRLDPRIGAAPRPVR